MVFSNALDKCRDHPEVNRRMGDNIKGYGRDHGGKREGRRNFIECVLIVYYIMLYFYYIVFSHTYIHTSIRLKLTQLPKTHRHTNYKDEEDGTKRTRVRFNLEGQHGKAFVFAEVSSGMSSGEFVYRTYSI